MPRKKAYRMFLTDRDEYVPDGFVSITEIFTNPQMRLPGYTAEEWCLGEKRLRDMRAKTYYEVRKRFYESNAVKYDAYWNSNIDAINASGLNEFSKLQCFVVLSGIMVAFETRMETKYMKGSKRKYISWGVRKTLYRKYYDYLKEKQNGNDDMQCPHLFEPKKRTVGRMMTPNVKRKNIVLDDLRDGKKYFQVDKNDIYYAFANWCKLNKYSQKRAFYMGAVLLMEKYPTEGIDFSAIGSAKTDIDRQFDVGKVYNISNSGQKKFFISPELNQEIKDIILRFNNDPENLGKQPLAQQAFLLQAIYFYIKHLPLKYTNPNMYKEYIDAKKAEEYNQEIANK